MRWLFGILPLCLFVLGATAHAVELIGSPRAAADGGLGNMTVTWRTDVPCGTRLSLGTQLDKMEPRSEAGNEVTDTHSVSLKGLQPGTTYYYTVGSAKQRLGAGNFVVPPVNGASPMPSAPGTSPPKSFIDKIRDAVRPKAKAEQSEAALPAKAPPTAVTWGNPSSLQDHFVRHGADFQSRNADDYAAKAWLFLQRARAESLPMKLDGDALRIFDPATGAFAAYNLNGTTKTYFKPGNPAYWQRQPGRLVKPSQLPPSLQSSRTAP